MTARALGGFTPLAWMRRQRFRLRPWMLCYVLLVDIAAQLLLKTWSEVLEILLFLAIIGVYLALKLAAQGPRGLLRMVTETRVQQLAALFILALMAAFIWGDKSPRSVLALLRLPTYLVVAAVVVDALRREERMNSFAWTMLVSITLLFGLIFVEYYFGSDAVGMRCEYVERCITRKIEGWHWAGLLHESTDIARLATNGGDMNVSVIAEAYGIVRVVLFGVLGCAVGTMLTLRSRRLAVRALAAAMTSVLVFGLIISASRAGLLGLGVMWASLLALHVWSAQLRRAALWLAAVIAAVTAAGVVMSMALPVGETVLDRVSAAVEDVWASTQTLLDPPEPQPPTDRMAEPSAPQPPTDRIADPSAPQPSTDRAAEPSAPRPSTDRIADPSAPQPSTDRAAEPSAPRPSTDRIADPSAPQPSTDRAAEPSAPRPSTDRAADPPAPWPSIDRAAEPTGVIGRPLTSESTVPGDLRRLRNWQLAMDMFTASPVVGAGYRTYQPEARRNFPFSITVGVHSGYLKILSETGLLGFVPFLAMTGYAAWALLRREPDEPAAAAAWRSVFLSALAAMLAMNLTDTHSSDRFFWVVLAVAAAAEVRRRRRRELRSAPQPANAQPAPPALERRGQREADGHEDHS